MNTNYNKSESAVRFLAALAEFEPGFVFEREDPGPAQVREAFSLFDDVSDQSNLSDDSAA